MAVNPSDLDFWVEVQPVLPPVDKNYLKALLLSVKQTGHKAYKRSSSTFTKPRKVKEK